jgi:hypothetical protein
MLREQKGRRPISTPPNKERKRRREKEDAETDLAQDLGVTEDNDTVFRPRQRNVQPPRVAQEPDALMLVASDAGEDDVVLLSPLERIDARDLDVLVEFLLERAVELHVVNEIRPLPFVRRDDSDLVREDAGLEELGDDLLDVRGFGSVKNRKTRGSSSRSAFCEKKGRSTLKTCKPQRPEGNVPVEERRSARRDLLRPEVLVEHHRRICDRPGEVDVLPDSLGSGDSVLERALVEHVGGELGEARVHSVLDLETDRSVAEHDETLEERLGETGSGGFLVHNDGSELLTRGKVDNGQQYLVEQ